MQFMMKNNQQNFYAGSIGVSSKGFLGRELAGIKVITSIDFYGVSSSYERHSLNERGHPMQ